MGRHTSWPTRYPVREITATILFGATVAFFVAAMVGAFVGAVVGEGGTALGDSDAIAEGVMTAESCAITPGSAV